MHRDVAVFLQLIRRPDISDRRLKAMLLRMSGNDFGPGMVTNSDLVLALNAVRDLRPKVLTRAELASLYHAVR